MTRGDTVSEAGRRFEPFHACLQRCPRLLMFTGKGGVGKTTCAAAAAIALADSGVDTLLFSTDPAHSVSDSLGHPIGPEIRQVPGVPHLWALEIDAASALSAFKHRFGDELYDLITTATYLSDEDAQALLDLQLPGLDELMGLHRIMELLHQEPPRFRYLVWDSAPTGHTLRLLELPAMVDQWVRVLAGITWKYRDVILPYVPTLAPEEAENDLLLSLKRTIRDFTRAVRDIGQSRLVPVTIAEPMAGAETLRLIKRLQELHIPVPLVVVNGIHPANASCAFCTTRHQQSRAYLADLAARLGSLRIITLAARPQPVRGVESLRAMGRVAAPAE